MRKFSNYIEIILLSLKLLALIIPISNFGNFSLKLIECNTKTSLFIMFLYHKTQYRDNWTDMKCGEIIIVNGTCEKTPM